jgi:hypothetical protein
LFKVFFYILSLGTLLIKLYNENKILKQIILVSVCRNLKMFMLAL